MRYEDASQISTDVTARDDTEHLAGNDFGPATGNIITGTGTVSGATGTDSGGNITAIAGAGGSDTSFDANGMLEVAGQYGTLTIDAQGNYTYVRAPGSPEGVNDTFTYTLANDAGATDTAQLVIAIGNPPILQAQGNQTVLQNGNVVTLPPGVELSDVRVVGRDLVITLPDGSTMVIPDGAVFVPQLVVNGVEVPASNLAALLIDSEPKPAAGELTPAQQSGGGNFALPPGPLDPGVPLGDLLPPTELDYTPPEDKDIFDALENDPPVISPSSVNVSDEGVSTVDVPIPDNSGSPDTTNLRIVNGHINVVDPDGDPVTITLGEPTNALTSQGDPIDWSVSPDGHTVIGTAGGIEVIRIVINNNGDYTVTQSRPIDHPNSSIEDGVSFVVPVFATDGEDAALPGSIIVTIEDDSPVVDNVTVQGGVTLDETEAGSPAGFPISGTTDGAVIVNADGGFGADGAAEEDSIVYGLGLTGGVASLASGIQTAIGNHAITLVQVSSTLIEGRYTDGGTQVAFTIEMNGDGSVTLTQNVPLEHLTDGPPGPAHDDSLDLGGLVNATVTYTDFDGDSDTGTAPIGENLVFKDDGPNAGLNEQIGAGEVILDETRDEGTDTDDGDPVATDPPGLASDTLEFADNFFAPDFGADGAGTVTYQLLLSGPNVGSGLYALEAGDTDAGDGDGYGQGAEIVLNLSGNTITGSAGGVDYFTITINPNSGQVTFTQLNPIWHPVIGDFDETATLNTDALNDIQVQQTVTDSDGDFDTAAIGVGQGVFKIQDDGPDPYDPCPDDVISVNDPDADPFTGDLNLPDVGEDEPGVVTFGVSDHDPVLDKGGNPVTSGDDPLFYFINGDGVLEARVGDDPNGELIFTITLNGDGTFTYDQIGTIGTGGVIEFSNFDEADAGNTNYVGLGNDDAASTVDLLMSAGENTDADADIEDTTVNTDSDSIGAQNQSMDADDSEVLRIDFVTNLQSNGAKPTGFSFDGHASTNSYLQTIPQVQGSQSEVASFKVWALDSTLTDTGTPDRNPTDGFSDATPVTITQVTIIDWETGATHVEDISGLANGATEELAFDVFVTRNADGSVTFSGIQEGDQYGVATGANDFNAIAIQATDHSFDLGVFAIGSVSDFEPVDLEVPIVVTDADGDAVECEIDIHIGEPLVVADVTVTVNEAGLSVGSDAGSDSEIQSGTLTPSGGTGPYTFTLLSPANGQFGNLVLNPDTGEFTYTLDTPFDSQPDADDGTNPELGAESFDVLITDAEGATHTATITVNIIDDVPTANDDNASQTVEDAPITVDVLANDVEGADGVDEDNSPAVKVELVDGTLSGTGTLEYNEDGTFTYTPGAGEEGTVTFDYQITDNDGDTSVATVTIELQRDSVPQVGQPQNLIVDEDGLAGANVDAAPLQADPGEVDSTESATATGQVTVNFGDDVPGAPLADSIELLDDAAYDGQLTDLDGNPVTFALNGSGQLVGTANGVQVMIISITGAVAGPGAGEVTYTYQAQLLQPVKHADEGNNENTDLLSGIQFRVTDSDGDPATGSFNVTVVDDVPSAADVEVTQSGEDANVVVDITSSITPGADGVDLAEVTFSAHTGSGTLSYNDAGVFTYDPAPGETGDVTFTYTVIDGDGDEVTADITIHLQDDSAPQIGQPQNLVVDEDGLAGANVDNAPLQGDPAEVDSTENATASGQVVVDFGDDVPGAPLVDSIELLDNIAYDGQLVDLDGNPVTFALNGSGQLVGTANGSTVMIISVTAAVAGPGAGQVTYTYQAQLLEPVKHADVGNNENTDILSGVQFRVTDSDGDPATGSFNVTVVDDVPSVVNAVAASGVTLDETDAGSPAGFPISDTSAAAMISATQVFGADGAAAVNSVVYGLAIVGGSPEPSGLATAIGDHPITLVQIDSDTIQGQYNGANVAFTIQMNGDGTVTLTQEVPLEHLVDGSTPAAHDDSLNLAGLVNATIAITDGDGDTATGSAGIGNLLVFKDDGPTIDVTAVEEEGVVLTTQDAETDGNPTNEDTDVTAIEFDSVFNLSFDAGADGLGGASPALSYDLNVTAQNSGLTSHGQVINLFEVGGVIYGTTAAVAPANAATPGVVFSLAVSGTGVVTLTQYQQVDHAVEGVTTAPFDDQFATLVNGKISLTASASITDGDGDTATDQVTIDLGGNIRFADDGPNANDDNVAQTTENAPVVIDVFANDASGADGVDLATGITLVPGSLSGSGNLVYNGDGTFTYTPAANEEANVTFQYKITDFDGDTDTATVTIDLQPDSNPVAQNEVAFLDDDGLPAGNGPTGTNGIDANAGGDPPGDSNPSEAIWSSFLNASFGGDTPGSFSFAESLEALPAVTVGQETVTYTVSPDGLTLQAIIEDSPDNSREGLTLFTVAITNATTGAYTVTLNRNVLHETMDGTAEDDTENVVDPVVVIPFTATDSQGESTTANLSITFDDDEPDDINSEDVIVDNADGASATGSLDTLDDGDVDNEVGADQPGTIRFDPSLEDAATGLKSGGADVHYHLSSDGQTLVASTLAVYDADTFDPAAAPSHVVFTVTLNHDTTPGADDDYTVEMFGTLDNGSGFVISDFSAAPAGQNEWIGLDSDGGDINLDNNNSPDLLLTPTNVGGTVNTDSDDIANGNQWMTAGEGIRIDYVIDVRRDGANDEKDAQGYLFDSHFNANGSSFKIIQTQGSGSGASVRITALNDADTGNIKTLGGSIVPIDQSSIVVTGDASYTIVNMNDGTFVITGLAAGAVVTFDTNGADYNAISITSAAGLDNPNVAGTNLFGGQDFAIGQFGFFTEQAGEDLSIELPVILTDSDGDSESTNLDITFAVPNSMALMSTESSSFRMQSQEVERTAANSNNVVLAAAIGAAGFAATGAAAETPSFDGGDTYVTNALAGRQTFADFSGSEFTSGKLAGLSAFQDGGFEFGAMAMASTSRAAMMASHIGELTTSLSLGSGPNALLEATDLAEMMHAPAPAMAMDVGMASLELIQQAASVNAQTTGAVEQILADALNGGGATPDIDSLLNALPQAGNGEIAGLNNLATQAGDHVPTWDMGHGGVFTFDVANVMQAMTLHHDAVQPVANG